MLHILYISHREMEDLGLCGGVGRAGSPCSLRVAAAQARLPPHPKAEMKNRQAYLQLWGRSELMPGVH